MEIVFLALVPAILWIWLCVLGSIAIVRDETLESFQTIAQLAFVWLVPYIGLFLVIYLVNSHSPNVIPRRLVLWPFRSMILGPQIPANINRDEDDGLAQDMASRNWHSSGSNIDGGSGD